MSRPFTLNNIRTTFNYQDLTWSGVKLDPFFHPNASMGQIVVNALSRAPHNVGQICHEDGHEMRNWEILRNSVRVSLNLRDLGLQQGDVLGLAAGNSRDIASVVFGAMLNGVPVGTLDPSFEFSDIVHMFGITTPKMVVCDEVNYNHVKKALMELKNPAPIYVFDGTDEKDAEVKWKSVRELLKAHPDENSFVTPSLSNCGQLPAAIVCSSGSTGSPKAIPISHTFLGCLFQDPMGVPSSSTMFSFSSLYWMSGLSALLKGTLNNIVRIIVKKPFNPKLFLDIVKTRKVQFVICPPAQLQMLLLEKIDQDDMKTVKMIMCGGSAVPQSLIESFKVPILSGYGLTEGGGISLAGQLFSGVVVKIVDDEGNNLSVGDRGEICAKTPVPFMGYYRNEEATKEMLKDGFLHTGDIGLFDENGMLHVVDRKKEIFKYNNFHINPTDIELELQNLHGVGLVSVVGIPDPVYASLPAAMIVRKEGSTITEQDVHTYAKEHLPHYKWLRGGVYFVDDFPMTASGKIIRRLNTNRAVELHEKRTDIGFQY